MLDAGDPVDARGIDDGRGRPSGSGEGGGATRPTVAERANRGGRIVEPPAGGECVRATAMVAEAAVVGRPDEIKGQAVSAFVTLKNGQAPSEENKNLLRQWVAKEIGPIAKPDDIRFTDSLPKTRSGKIMRRLLRELATNGEVKGDTTTLEDFSVLAKLSGDED